MNRQAATVHSGETTLGDRAAQALVAYRAGDGAPLAAFVAETTPLLWHVVRAQGVGHGEAEDVVQGVWLAFVRSEPGIREPEALLAWLLVSARRAAWLAVRRTRDGEHRTVPLPDDVDEVRELPEVALGPEAEVLTVDRDRRLWRTFLRLPERCQQVLRAVAAADRPDYRAIAAATGMKVTAVGITRGRCLAKLRALLEQDGTGDWT